MKRIIEYIKTSKVSSKIFLGLWVFFIATMTLGCIISEKDGSIANDIFLLIYMYILFGGMFLVPALTIYHSSKAALNQDGSSNSSKSWIATLLLSLFLGHIGAHRFYTGKYITGIIYLFTAGGFGLGNIVDLILIAIGKFPDKNSNLIKYNKINRSDISAVYTPPIPVVSNPVYSVPKTEKPVINVNNQKKLNSENTRGVQTANDNQMVVEEGIHQWIPKANTSSQYSDVIVSGTEEKTQSIPKREVIPAQEKPTAETGAVIKINLNILDSTNDSFKFDFDYGTPYSSTKFFRDMAKYESKDGKEAAFVPFMEYWPTYDSMSKPQKDWYFYWRGQVRKGVYLATDLSYIFVHVYELLSGYGWKNAQEGYEKISSLWTNYRNEYPKLDHYLISWLFDFAQLHNLEYSLPVASDVSLPHQLALRDIMIDKHADEKPLKLSFALIDALCDYSLVGSKFYKDGHQLLMKESIPRVVALADAALIKKKGKGILKTYGPNRTKKQVYYAFQSANCIHANKRIDLTVKGYTSSQKLRGYINELVRYAENVLRELYGCRGRLRGVALDEETASLVKSFLKKEYSPQVKSSEPKKKVEVKLDFENINELRNQSDAVRDALEVTETVTEEKELLTDLDTVKEIFVSMPTYCRALIDEMQSHSWEIPYNPLVQASIEKINELSGIHLACSILVVEENTLILEDDYRDEFEYIYEHIHEIEEASVANESEVVSRFKLEALSDEMQQLIQAFSPVQEEILCIVLTQDHAQQHIEEIASAEMSMPEILIDEINDIATQYIGDIIIDTFGDEMCVLEQYENELNKARK